MKASPVRRASRALCLLLAVLASPLAGADDARPNILLILADDLGYSDIGAFGGEIDTPHLDALIAKGHHLASMYVAPTCSPTRSMLMSGVDHHLAGVGNMAEILHAGLAPEQVGAAGYEGHLNHHIAALPELMQAAGYRTLMAGKWHLGLGDGLRPAQRGFDHSWALLNGGAAHFKQTAPMQILRMERPPIYLKDDQPVELPDDFYSTRTYTEQLIAALEHTRHSGKPFFAYAAYTAPHWPIQAPDEAIAKYRGRYDGGYEALAAERMARLKARGLAAADAPLVPMPQGVPPWASLSAAERAISARTMEAYAGMVDILDAQIGRLVDYLEKTGQLDNTLIIFLSDNGPEGGHLSRFPGMSEWMDEHFDLSLDNIGRPGSFAFTGPAWAQVSALPHRYFKSYTHEGGIRSASFVVFPQRIAAGRSQYPVSVMDVMPTILDAAGIQHPGISWQGRNVLPMQGMSLLPWLEGRASAAHAADMPMGFELMGHTALRKGEWKIVFNPENDNTTWALYHLRDDPGELTNLAHTHADTLDELLTEWLHYVQHNNLILTGRGKAALPQR